MIFFSGEGEFKPQLTTAWTEIPGDTKQRQAVGQGSSLTLCFEDVNLYTPTEPTSVHISPL